MGFLGNLFGGSRAKKLIDTLSFESPSDSGRWRHGTTWAARRDAAAALGALGDKQAVAPLRSGINDALAHLRWMRGELTAAEVECLVQWTLTPLVHHSDSEWQSLPARTGSALSIIHIGGFEWAWATAVIHAEALARLGDQAAPQDLLAELRQIDGAQWRNAEALLHNVTAAAPAASTIDPRAPQARKATSSEHYVLRCIDCGFEHHIPADRADPTVRYSVDPGEVKITCLYGGAFTVTLKVLEFFHIEPAPVSGRVLHASVGENVKALHAHMLSHCDPLYLEVVQTPNSTDHTYTKHQPMEGSFVKFSGTHGLDIVGDINIAKAEIAGAS